MQNKLINKKLNRNHLMWPVLLVTVLIAGILSVWWFASRIEKNMRNDLLIQAQLVAGAINLERIKTLTGTEADLTSPDYLRRKEMLATVRAANPKCRFVYLMGQSADGTVFFFADSEPIGSEDESPAGQVYEYASPELLQVFDTQIALTEGPLADRWGVWISALAPLTDTETGKLIGVLGMDFDAHTWKYDIAIRTALPAGLMLVLLAMIFLIVVLRHRTVSLQLNEQKYRYLFEGAAGGIAIIRGDRIEFANPALARIAGHPIEKLTSMPFIKLIHPDDQLLVQDRHQRRMQGESVETGYDFRFIAADGTVRWINISSQLIHWEGAPANLSFITEITDRKQAEEKLAAMYEETSRMNRLMQGREERMLELKKEVNRLLLQLNQDIKYKSAED